MIVASAILALSLLTAEARAEFKVPAMESPVQDEAGMLDSRRHDELDQALRAVAAKGGPQIAVLTVRSLEGLPIEQAALKVVEKWKLGGAKTDNGALLLVSSEDRRIRIEVGQGLEGTLTDADSKRIIDDVMVPYFRKGRASDGIAAGVVMMLRKTAPEMLDGDAAVSAPARERKGKGFNFTTLMFLLLLAIFFSIGRRRRRSSFGDALLGGLIGSSIGRGGGGFGGRSGGGWSGGGGGFSGGGASGSW